VLSGKYATARREAMVTLKVSWLGFTKLRIVKVKLVDSWSLEKFFEYNYFWTASFHLRAGGKYCCLCHPSFLSPWIRAVLLNLSWSVAPCSSIKTSSFVLGFAISRQSYLVKASARGSWRTAPWGPRSPVEKLLGKSKLVFILLCSNTACAFSSTHTWFYNFR